MLNSRNTYVEVDLRKIEKNYQYIKSKTKSKINVVLKSNAYGHGIVKMGKYFNHLGVEKFSVAFFEEAQKLREVNLNQDILIFNYVDPKYIYKEKYEKFIFTIFSILQLEEYIKVFKSDVEKIRFEVKLNTGMNRLGLKEKNDIQKLNEYKKKYNLKIEGVYTHCYYAENIEILDKQKKLFEEIVSEFNFKVGRKHMANSCAFFQGEKYHFDEVRIGMALYGLQPFKNKMIVELKEAIEWKSVISHINYVKKGENIGYGNKYYAEKDKKIAIVPIGYYDGYKFNLQNKADVVINCKRYKIISEICMEQIIIDISDAENIELYNEVYIIGGGITVKELAKFAETVSDDIVSGINTMITRKYKY